MSLTTAALCTASVPLAAGLLLLWNGRPVAYFATAFPRSQRLGGVLFAAASLLFLWRLLHISPADEIFPKAVLLPAFGALALLSFFFARDFIAVRGVCALALLAVGSVLEAGFLREPPPIFLNATVYAVIFAALWLAARPYQLRDAIEWLFARPGRARGVGACLTVHALALASWAVIAA